MHNPTWYTTLFNNDSTIIQRHDFESKLIKCWFNVVCLLGSWQPSPDIDDLYI